MYAGWNRIGQVLALSICVLAGLCSARAETRRAVIVGINQYALNPATDRATNLDGAVNDAEALAETLRTYHGFRPTEIHLLLDQQASRARIIQAIEEHLISAAQPGDISLFFFAGHGSYQENPSSQELDRRDETIVPADSNRKIPDITDKQIARLLHRAIDRQAHVIAIFDSCHSGSISRGFFEESKTRTISPWPRGALPTARAETTDAARDATLDARGAVILAAAQDQQQAEEKYVKGRPRGRFSSALQQLLNSPIAGESLDYLYLRLRALMQAGGSQQEPVLLAKKDRRTKTLWNAGLDEKPAPALVAVGRITSTLVGLSGGYAIGLGVNAELRSHQAASPVRLQVIEILGPGNSLAKVLSGSLGSVKPGDLFAVEKFGAPYFEPLRVFVPANPPSHQALDKMVRTLSTLSTAPGLKLIQDPTESTVTHTLHWRAGQWALRDADGREVMLGTQPTITQLRKLVRSVGTTPATLFISVPPSAERLIGMQNNINSAAVELVKDQAQADYLLVGRIVGESLEYAWVAPGVDKRKRPGAPPRSAWLSSVMRDMTDHLAAPVLRLARWKSWHVLDTPAGANPFPYSLRLQNLQTQALLPPGARVREGESFRPVLVAAKPLEPLQPRYVYLFALDSAGDSTLIVPGGGMGVGENLVPDGRSKKPPQLIPLGDGIRVSAPFGVDTLVLLTTATALPDPSVLQSTESTRGVTTRSTCTQPLECLIFGINDVSERGRFSAPTDWSIERLLVESSAK